MNEPLLVTNGYGFVHQINHLIFFREFCYTKDLAGEPGL